MDEYKIYFRESVEKDIRLIPKKDMAKILQKISPLSTQPHPEGCEKLTDKEYYRIRQGRYRIIYSIQDDTLTIWVIKIGHRKDIYRK